MKKIAIILCLILSITVPVYALDVETSVSLNGDYIQGDAKHLLKEDRVYVVARTLTDALGQEIQWLAESQQVHISHPDLSILLTIGQSTAVVNEEVYTLDAPPFIQDGRTYIPLRMVSEVLGCQVEWDSQTYTAHITKADYQMDQAFVYQRPYSDDDLFWLSKIVEVESDFQSVPMKIGIANVVLNRVKDPRFPNTVHDVIFDNVYAVQFPPAFKSTFKTLTPTPLSIMASKKALEGVNNVENCLYFNNAPFRSRADDLFIIIEGEYFYK